MHYEQSVEKAMGKMALDPDESYPERLDEPDCAYYMRTGLCGYGSNCRFNHPPHVKQANSGKGEFPERVGQPECQYYLKTGTCKFGASCKYHHPRDRNTSGGQVQINYLGLPMRQGEKDCAYYMRTGTCKFGAQCKFHHPQLTALVPVSGYASAGSPTTPASPFHPGILSWPLQRTPYVASPRLQGSPAYMPVIFSPSQAMLSMPNWNNYQGNVSPLLSPERQTPIGTGNSYNSTQQIESPASSMQGVVSPFVQAGALHSVGQREAYPERHGVPDCQYYMKTGDCKFGTTCKYHHPKERIAHSPTCMLSPKGLPLRPDQPACTFYARYGICKFGPTCKFDHPLGAQEQIYSSPSSSLSEQPYPRVGSQTTLGRSSSAENSQVVLTRKDHPSKLEEPKSFKNLPSTNGSVDIKEADASNSGSAVLSESAESFSS